MNYKIVADSTADLLTVNGVDFASVPLKIVTDEREFSDDANLDRDEMLEYLASYKGHSGTSCPSVGDWLEAFGEAEGIFTVAISSGMSGSYNASVQAKTVYEDTHPDRRVCCLDTLTAGPEMVLIVEKLVELIGQGKDFDTIEAEIRAYMHSTHLVFVVESLNNMAKNGRVSHLIAKACGLLGIRILSRASEEGTLQPLHKCRGEKKVLPAMLKEMVDRGFRGGKVRIAHCANPNAAEAFAAMLKEEFPGTDVTVGETRGLCSFYAERGGLLVGYEA